MNALQQVAAVVGSITTIATAAGWLLWPRFNAFITREVITPVQESHKQLTVNSHSSASPTILDALDDIRVMSIGAAQT